MELMEHNKKKQCTYLWNIKRIKEEKRLESLFKEPMAEKFPNLARDLDVQVHEARESPQNFNTKPLFQGA